MEGRAPDLSQDEITIIFGMLDLNLNTTILQALLHGLYTGIVVVTLWIMFFSPKHLHGTFLRTVIIMLYVLATIEFAIGWAFIHRAFIEYGDNYIKVFGAMVDHGLWWRLDSFVNGITGGISTLLVDTTIIWRCWVLWDRQWRIVSLPIVCTIAAMSESLHFLHILLSLSVSVMKIMQMLSLFHDSTDDISRTGGFLEKIDWSLTYILLLIATTLTSTVLIVYRVVRQGSGMSASRKIIKMLIESSAIYSLSLIVYLALVSKNSKYGYYADIIAVYVRAIAPTLLVYRISAHANASSRRQQMVTMLENHPPLVGCFREEGTENSHPYDDPNDGHQTVSGSSGEETV